jgi:hypothetical protein
MGFSHYAGPWQSRLPAPLHWLRRLSSAISLLLAGELHLIFLRQNSYRRMLQAPILTNLACPVLPAMITVSRSAMRDQLSKCAYLSPGAPSPVPFSTLAYEGLPLCLR